MKMNNSTKPRPTGKILEQYDSTGNNTVNYIDPIDLQILKSKSKIDQIYYKQ